MPYQVYPEYEFFTGVEIKFSVDGDASKTFIISKLGEHFQGLTVTEGSVSGDKQVATPTGNHLSNGTLTLYDEDNSIFNSLLASKSSEGNPLVNKVDITLNTYTGSRKYQDCRVDNWSCSFNGGVPTITIKWQGFPSDSQPSTDNTSSSAFDPKLATQKLVEEGIQDFKELKAIIKEVFTTQYTFVYSPTREYTVTNLTEISEDELKVFTNETDNSGTMGYIFIPDACKNRENGNQQKVFRMELKGNMDNFSFLSAILSEFCKTAKITLTKGTEKDNIGLGFTIIGNKILMYSYTDTSRLTMPQPTGTAEILNNTVFVYNSSLHQGEIYKTPQGEKRVFNIEELSTTFEMKDIIKADLNNQSNASNPNGNFIMTSRGAITVPENMPQALAQTIQNLAGLSLSQNLQVRMNGVYNFIHFYCLGETPVYIIAFDHKGNVHPLSGRMRVGSYSYSLGVDGVIKADVTLTPLFSSATEDYVAPVVGTVSGSNSANQSSLPNTSSSTSYGYGDYPYSPSTQSSSYVHTGMSLDSAVDYTII